MAKDMDARFDRPDFLQGRHIPAEVRAGPVAHAQTKDGPSTGEVARMSTLHYMAVGLCVVALLVVALMVKP